MALGDKNAMRRFLHLISLVSSMLTIPILLLSTWGSDLITGVSANLEHDIQLGAFLEPGEAVRRSPSCVHTFASLQMVNTHENETITIYSMETLPSRDRDNIEIYASHFANRVIKIKPKESTTIPIKFFPQIPSYYSDCNYSPSTGVSIPGSVATDSGDPWHYCLSMTAAADFADLGGNALMGSDFEDVEHAVNSTLLIHTSRGRLEHTILASASKHNPYRVPHSILFHSDGFVSNSDLNYAGRESAYSHRLEHNVTDDKAYEFDLYMDNINVAEELRIIEIFTSRDDLFDIKYFHLGGYRGNNLAYYRYNNCGPAASDIRHCNQPKAHEMKGPIFVPTDGKRSYIATIKLKKEATALLPDDEGRTFLGYLQIITSRDDLSIVLEFERHKDHNKLTSRYYAAKHALEGGNVTRRLTGVDAYTIHDSGRYPSRDARHSCDFMRGRKSGSRTRQKPKNKNTIYVETPAPTVAVSSSLNFIDFGVLTSLADAKVQDISITNHGNVPLHLMRAKITTDFGPQFSYQKQGTHSKKVDDFRLAVKAVIAIAEDDESRVIQPGATVDDIVTLSISPNSDVRVSQSELPLVYHGSAIIHAGRVDQSYYDWKQMVVNDPTVASNYIVEIAFTVRVIYGHIEFDIEDIYFPAKRENSAKVKAPITEVKSSTINDGNAASRTRGKHSCDDSFDRTLHFTNIFPTPLQLKRVRIKGATGSDPSFLSHDFCSEHFHIVQVGDGERGTNRLSDEIAYAGQSWGGITLRYIYSINAEYDFFRESKRCTLTLETDLAGEFDIPLWIFSGLVQVRPEHAVISPQCRATSGSGLGCLASTFNRLGKTILSRLSNSNDGQEEQVENRLKWHKGWLHNIIKELLLMGQEEEGVDLNTYLEPVVLSLGPLVSESIRTYSIFVTNHNPTEVSMTALVPSVEGTEIRLGRTVANVMDYMHGAKLDAPVGKMSTSPGNRAKDWLKTYLSTTNISQKTFGSLRYRDDIYLSRTATEEIKQLFYRNATITMHQNRFESGENVISQHTDGINLEQTKLAMHPPVFTNATISAMHMGGLNGSSMFSVPTVSTKDGIFASKLLRGCNKANTHATWVIPPGGVIRLEISVRPPPRSALLGREYVDFISTGVVLETNFGQRLPFIVEYRALAGEVYMDTDKAVSKTSKTANWLNTPAIIRPNNISTKKQIANDRHNLPKDDRGTEVLIKNTFPQGAILKKVYSCNNWFSIMWDNPSIQDGLEPVSASVYSSISCQPFSTSKSGASFYDCALAWIEQRHQIQQGRCEMKEEEFTDINSIVTEQDHFSENQIEVLRSKLILQLKNTIAYLDRRYQEGSQKIQLEGNRSIPVFPTHPGQEIDGDILNKLVSKQMGTLKDNVSSQNTGIIALNVLDMFDEVVAGWNAISTVGLNVVTGNVRADIDVKNQDYSSKDSASPTTSEPLKISIPLASPSLQSALEIPRIYDPRNGFAGSVTDGENNLQFNITPVAQVAQLYVPVRNPSGTPIRVRLATMLSHKRKSPPTGSSIFYASLDSDFFVQTTSKELNPWWTGGSYYLADHKGTMMGSTHNVTLKAGKGASLRLSNPSLHSSVAFVQGCVGRRCGYSVPKDPKKTISPQAYVSSIGASAATGETLRGRYYNRDGGENEMSSSAGSNNEESQPFALGLKSLQEIIIPPFGVGQVGPIFFRPPSRRAFKGLFFLENNLTGLEHVIVEGRGGWEKVVFFDSLAMGMNGDDLESRYGKPTLIFSGSNNDGSIIKSVVVANVGDTEVKFENAHLSEASISRSNKHGSKSGHQSSHQSKNLLGSSRCSKRGFTLLGCYDHITSTKEEDTNGVTLPIIRKIIKYASMLIPESVRRRRTKDHSNMTNILDGFSLLPNETKVLYISHTPDSTFSSMYIALNLEVKRVDDGSQCLNPQDLQSTAQHGLLQDKTLQLLLGYDQRSSETKSPSNKKPDHPVNPFYVEIETLKPFIQRIVEVLIALVPLFMLFLILLDMFSGSRQRYAASKSFEAFLYPPKGSEQTREHANGKKNDTDNWIFAYRCLTRTEQNFSDLQHIGKEQTRQMLLGRYRKNKILHPQCILSNGTFVREKQSSSGHGDGNDVKGGSTVNDERSASPMLLRRNTGSLTVIFCHCRDLNVEISSCDFCRQKEIPVTPYGLYWREATRRGIIPNSAGISVLEHESASINISRTPSPEKIVAKEELPQKLVGITTAKKTTHHGARTFSSPRFNYHTNDKANGRIIKPTVVEIEPANASPKFKATKPISHNKTTQAPEKSKTAVRSYGKLKINTKVTKQSKVSGIAGHGKNLLRGKNDASGVKKESIVMKDTERQPNTVPIPMYTKSSIRNRKENTSVSYASKVSKSIVVSPKPLKQHSVVHPIKKINQALELHEKVNKVASCPTLDEDTLETSTNEIASVESDEIIKKVADSSSSKVKPKPLVNSLSNLSVQNGFPQKDQEKGSPPLLCSPSNTATENTPRQNTLSFPLEPDLTSQQSSNDGRSALSVIGEDLESHNLPVRPPPGLSPPPGFSSHTSPKRQSNKNNTDSLEKSSDMISPGIVSPHIKDSNIFEAVLLDSTSKLGEELKSTNESPLSPPKQINSFLIGNGNEVEKSPKPIEDMPLLGLGNDFNVMGFLESSFLPQGIDDENTEQDKIDDSLGILPLSTNSALSALNYNTMPSSTHSSSIRSNPWGGNQETPRALAYGIEVEGEVENSLEAHLHAPIFDINGVTSDGDNSDMKKDEFIEEDAFFSNLLEEE